jgi:hypothetical protein
VGFLGATCNIGFTSGSPVEALRSLIHSTRRLTNVGGCYMTTNGDVGPSALADSFEAALENCTQTPCAIDCSTFQDFDSFRDDCKSAGGALHLLSFDMSCDGESVEVDNFPECRLSDPMCSPGLYEYTDLLNESDDSGCVVTATRTGTPGGSAGESDSVYGNVTWLTEDPSNTTDAASRGAMPTGGINVLGVVFFAVFMGIQACFC